MSKKHSVEWNNALLRQNPFPEIPPRSSEEAVWAGMPALKEQFINLFAEAQNNSGLQVVLNHGDYGSGKTHAAVYFGTSEHWPKGKNVKNVINLYVRTPKDAAHAEKLLYQDILESIGFKEIRRLMRETIERRGLEESAHLLHDFVESEVLINALLLLGQERRSIGQLQLFEDADYEWHRLLEAYFYSQQSKSDLKILGLGRGIEGSRDRFRILSGILQCLIGLDPIENLEIHNRVVLWIDEMEDLIYFPSRQYLPFTQSLRDLIDRLPQFFTLLVNFTLATPEAFEDVSVVLGKALMDRFTHKIYFRPPSEIEAYKYATDLLGYFRNQKPGDLGLPESYPFEEAALKEIIGNIRIRTPREINKSCSDVITKALMRDEIRGTGEGIISVDFVNALLQENLDQELQ